MPAERRTIWPRSCGVVELEPERHPEAVAQGRGEQPGARGGAHQRELGQVERDEPRARALPHGDRELAVLHRRIEGLLERPRQAVDLVHEEDRPRLEPGEVRGDVALALEGRPGGLAELHAELGGDDLGERGLAQPGGPGEQHVVERLVAAASRLDEDAQLLLDGLLPDELVEPPGPQRAVELLLGLEQLGVVDALDAGRSDATHRAAPFSASSISSSARLALGPVEQLVGLLGPEAEPDQAVAGERARVVGGRAADHDLVADAAGHLLAQLDDDPLGGALADAGHRLEARRVAGGDRVQELARAAARQHRERHLRPHALNPDQHQEQLALRLAGEAEELDRVVAHHEVREQGRLVPLVRHRPQGLRGHREPVADAAGLDHDLAGEA